MLDKTTDKEFPIAHPSTCLYKMLLKVNRQADVEFFNSLPIAVFEQIGFNRFDMYISFMMRSMVSSIGMFVNSDSTPYDIYSSIIFYLVFIYDLRKTQSIFDNILILR